MCVVQNSSLNTFMFLRLPETTCLKSSLFRVIVFWGFGRRHVQVLGLYCLVLQGVSLTLHAKP